MTTSIIKFGEFAPDDQDYDNPSMYVVENAVPIYGGYRAIRKANMKSSVVPATGSNHVTGAYAHIITEDVSVLHNKVNATDAAGSWFDVADGGTTDLHTPVNTTTPDDNTRIACRSVSQNPSFTKVQLGFPSISDPGGTASSDFHIDLRYRGFVDAGTAATITADIYQGAVKKTATTSWTASVSTGDNAWYYKRVTMNDTDADGITDWTDLSLHISGSISGMTAVADDLISYPTSDADNTDLWVDESATNTTDIYASIADFTSAGDSVNDATYISTPSMSAMETKTYKCALSTVRDSYVNTGHDLNFRIKSTVSSGMDISVKLLEDSTTIATTAVTDVGTSWSTETLTLSTAEADSIDDYSKLKAEFSYSYDGGGTATQYARPASDVSVGSDWTNKAGGSSNLYQEIDEASADDATTYVIHSGTNVGSSGASVYKLTLGAISEPEDHNNTQFVFRYRAPTSLNDGIKVRIYYDSGASYYEHTWTSVKGSTWQNKTWTLTSTQSQNLDWGSAFTVWIYKYRISGEDSTTWFTQMYLTASAAAPTGQISEVWLSEPGTQGFEISWQDFVTPDSQTEVLGDEVKIYAGTRERLYLVDESQWENVTRTSGGDYGQGTTTPQCWDFCSWGGNVIATNREDDVQYLDLENGATDFAKLIDAGSDLTPKAKFCDIVQNNLVLSNINLAGYFSYSVMWSHLNNPTFFSLADYTNLSDAQALRQKPGEITGFVGGEYGTIFKRTSIHRMSFIGGNLVYRFDQVAQGVGTAHPQSIVTVDDDIYFYGHNNFYVMPGGGKPVSISSGKVQQMLLESYWDERSLKKYVALNQSQNDLNIVGCYDMLSGLIFWSINNRHVNSTSRRKSDILVYNPSERKWGYIRDASFSDDSTKGISQLVTTPNVQEDTGYLLTNLNVLAHDTTGSGNLELWKFDSDSAGNFVLETNVISTMVLENEIGRMETIRRIRPRFTRTVHRDYISDANVSTFWPRYEITIYSSNDPYMIDDVEVVTAAYGSEDRNGWANISLTNTAEFWKFKLAIPSYIMAVFSNGSDNSSWYGLVRNFLSLEIDTQKGGMR